MDIEVIKSPVVTTVSVTSAFEGNPEVTGLNYDSGALRVTLDFPGMEDPVYAAFDSVRGFRVLDEGDLLEFWNPETRADGWIWMVLKGGWFDLESFREGFLSGVAGGYSEYLILGANDCVSVITTTELVIER